MRVALLSNVTVDLLAGYLKKTEDVYLSAGFDTWQQEIIIPTSDLYNYKPDVVVILLHANSYVDTWNNLQNGEMLLNEWFSYFRALCTHLPNIPVFVSSIDISNNKCLFGSEKRLGTYFENFHIKGVEQIHSEGNNIYILPVRELIINIGRENFYSSKMWYVGSMPYSIKALALLNELIIRYIGVIKGMHKKCLAVDLDNTLWGGVIGEDGVNGIILSNFKEGARYKDTQRLLKKMKDQGVMLAILSKNNVDDVEPVFNHPDMILQHDDFVAEIINWDSKSSNIMRLAKDLNIGLDSFVFLDDNPVEREQMISECPEVTVIDFPKDSSLLPDVISKVYDDYFLSLEVTGEDTNKTEMYRAETQRRADLEASVSVDDFLKRLEMTLFIHLMTSEEIKRVTQLVNKTNQFNLTTKRYSEEEINYLANSEDSDIITVHMGDKYGDQGLVSVIILKYIDSEALIDTFLMSCRVMGRNAEKEILARIKSLLYKKKIESVHASYFKTSKNNPVAELYDHLGFELQNATENQKDYIISANNLPNSVGVFKEVICEL